MVKAYLRYAHEEAFGLIASPHANVSFFSPASSPATRPSAPYVLTCSGASVLLWSSNRQCQLACFVPPAASTAHYAARLALSSSHSHLAVGYSDGSVLVWETPSASALAALPSGAQPLKSAPLLTLRGHRSAVTALCWGFAGEETNHFFAGGAAARTADASFETLLVSASADGDIIVWDRVAGVGLHRLHGHAAPVTQVVALRRRVRRGNFAESVANAQAEPKKRRRNGANNAEAEDGEASDAQTVRRKSRGSVAEAADAAGAGSAALEAESGGGDSREGRTGDHTLPGSGLLLISCGKDGLLKIWDADLELCLQTVVDTLAGASGAGEACSLAVNRQQTRLVVGCSDHMLRVYALHGFCASSSRSSAPSAKHGESDSAEGALVNPHTGLRCVASFLGFLKRPAGGQKKTTCMHFLAWGGAARELGDHDANEGDEEEEEDEGGVLVVGSGNSRAIEIFKVCGEAERKRRMKRRKKRAEEKKKKRDQKLREAPSAHVSLEEEEDKEADSAERVTDEFVFLSRLHTASVIKAFHLQGARSPHKGAPSERQTGKKASKAKAQTRGTEKQIEVVLGLADNAFEVWRVDVQCLADRLAQKESETGGSKQDTDAFFKQLSRVSVAGHRGTLRQLAVSHDSSYLLSIADEGFKVWTTHSRQCVKSVIVDLPLCGFFVAGNDHVVVGTKGGDLLLYDVGACAVRQHLAQAHGGAVNALAEHPKHTGFASISADKSVKLFVFHLASDEADEPRAKKASASFLQCRQVGSVPLPDQGIDVRYTMNGKFLICALLDMTILVFYADTCKLFLSLYGHHLPVLSLSVSSDSTLLATGSADKTVKIWGLDFGNIQQSLLAHDDAVTQVVFLFGTHYLLSASADASLKLWDVDRRACLVSILPSVSHSPLRCLVASQDGDRIFAADATRLLQSWRRTGEQMFAEEEEERRWEENAEREALREDAVLTSTATSATVVMDRASKRTMESVRSTERLMEVLDEAREQQEADEAYASALLAWERRRRELKKKTGSKDEGGFSFGEDREDERPIEGLPPRPAPPPGRVELMRRTAVEHVLRALATLKAGDTFEVLVALPFEYAYRLLEFLVAHLSLFHVLVTAGERPRAPESSKKRRRMTAEESEATADAKTAKDAVLCLCPIESAARVALILVQLHFRLFLASPKQRQLLARLQRCLRPLLVRERDRMRFNNAALTFLQRQMQQERFQALPDVGAPTSKQGAQKSVRKA
ncbi:WD domain, G-beta repeat-containing protein [Besnoitia besnoiti]|uniref:WD domain, G-beta repeat-containing protein n=1 Tax=Besnoitia besnoiti TaxID=94643 RepID=A0A2A9MMJ3_BESBE|nr:WD domain, G-beta repeat-containing protein [Besnoitia besnoiti]PFH38574.1 WD domain, G-beta repeat-containing protein [Besnoitia besnoiti]